MLECISARSEIYRAQEIRPKRAKHADGEIERRQKKEYFRKKRNLCSEIANNEPGYVYKYQIARKRQASAKLEIFSARLEYDEICKAYEQLEGKNIAVDVVIYVSEQLLV